MTHSPPSSCSFTSVEQLDEVMHALGWDTEYRQLEPGSFSSTFTALEGDCWFLMEEQTSRRMEVQAPAPAGMCMLALVEGDPSVVNGKSLCSDHVLAQNLGSELRGIVPAGVRITQIGIVAEQRVFAREMGTSPQQYVTARRLNAVRRRLLAADGVQGLGVTEVALSYGFTHLGRFSGDYRRYFGESPRETLQRR